MHQGERESEVADCVVVTVCRKFVVVSGTIPAGSDISV